MRPSRPIARDCARWRSSSTAAGTCSVSAAPSATQAATPTMPRFATPAPSRDTGSRRRVEAACTHLDQVQITQLPESVEGCEECLKVGDPWLHLRICLECGKVGCCDDSPNKHASAHARGSDHPLIRSLQPGEEWSWCYIDDIALLIPEVRGQTRIPSSPLGG